MARDFFCVLRRSSDYPVPNSVQTSLPWNVVDRNEGDLFSIGDPTKITVSAHADGLYLVTTYLFWDASNGSGVRDLAIKHTSGANVFYRATKRVQAPDTYYCELTASVLCAVGDVLELSLFQNCGSALAVKSHFVSGEAASPYMSVVHIGS